METYSLLREIADSWVLLGMFCFFVGVAIWAFLPSQSAERHDASLIPFRNETASDNCARDGASRDRQDASDNLKGLIDGQG